MHMLYMCDTIKNKLYNRAHNETIMIKKSNKVNILFMQCKDN